MPYNSGVNRVFLLGRISGEPHWQTLNGQRALYLVLSTTENIKKNGGSYEHTEWHNIKMPPEMLTDGADLKPGDLVAIQGKIQTRMVFEDGVKLYKTEVLVTNIEKLEFSDAVAHST
jgi:single-stranded DNA-binding protein